jgi:hypothetical protein
MNRSYLGLASGALLAVGVALSLPSCGHDQKLVGLQIQPQTFTFLTPDTNATEQFTAVGTYIHPPATKDLTNQVKWSVDFANVVDLTQGGMASPHGSGGCGGVDITATAPVGTGGADNILIATATAVVDDSSNILCPGGNKLGSLAVAVIGVGTVTSTPDGITCTATTGPCVSNFTVGASVLLTATPVKVAWANCPGASSNTCVITIPAGGTAVSATFQ